MLFDDLRINAYVKLNRALDTNWHNLSQEVRDSWYGQDLNTIWQVTRIVVRNEDEDYIELVDVKGNGAVKITRTEYIEHCNDIYNDLFVSANFSEAMASMVEDEDRELVIDVKESAMEILERIMG